MALNRGVKITWLGHATFKVVSPNGKVVVIDSWVTSNPASPEVPELKPGQSLA